jgi:hypothetical protein
MLVSVTKKRDYRPDSEALHGAHVLLCLSAEKPAGHYFQWMGSLLLSAFAFEGYLNFLGKVFFRSWESSEQWLSWKRKVKKLGDRIDFKVEEGCEPFLTVNLLFQFRNQIAHPKPGEFNEKSEMSRETFENTLAFYEIVKSNEEKFCNEANVKLCIEGVAAMMELLYDHAKIKFEAENPNRKDSFILFAPFVASGQSGSTSAVQPS